MLSDATALYQVRVELGALVAQRLAPAAVAPTRWAELVQQARHEQLALVLYWVLRRAHFALPDHAQEALLQQELQHATYHYLAQRAAQQQLQTAFSNAGIAAIWLKGIVLAPTVYPAPALRQMVDLDVLVPYESLDHALALAQKLGYSRETLDVVAADIDLKYNYGLIRRTGSLIKLEIHWRLLEAGGTDSLLPLHKLAWFWEPTQRVQDQDGFSALSPEAHLLYLCAHAILQDGESAVFLRHFFDLHRLVIASSINWEIVVAQAAALRWSAAVERALLIAQYFFATPLAADLAQRLQAAAQAQPGAVAPFKPKRATTTWDKFTYHAQRLTPGQRLRIAIRVLLPTTSYMRVRYRIAADQAVWPAYLRRWLEGARDVMRSLRLRRAYSRTGTSDKHSTE